MSPRIKPDEMREFDRALGKRIELTRTALEMRVNDLARAAGITAGGLYNYEAGIRTCPPAILAKIAAAMGVSVTALMPKFTNCGVFQNQLDVAVE